MMVAGCKYLVILPNFKVKDMSTKGKLVAQNPLLLRSHRLMEAFAKSDDERDFYLEREEGFLVYVDLDQNEDDLIQLEEELKLSHERYCLIPKLTFYETKKIMEGFVNEKVYDIDTKEKLLDIIHSKEARENFLEFIYDHHSELEKWQQYYQERSRIRIIEWLRANNFYFVFEEDLDLTKSVLEKLKRSLFQPKVGRDVLVARKMLTAKAKTYYSNEALNPRPKRGRPPKQAVKTEAEPQVTVDIYLSVPKAVLPFLFTPDISSAASVTFSSKFETEDDILAHRKVPQTGSGIALEKLQVKLDSLRNLAAHWASIPEGNADAKVIPSFFLESEEKFSSKPEKDTFPQEEDLADYSYFEEAKEEVKEKKSPKKAAPKKEVKEKAVKKKEPVRLRPVKPLKGAAKEAEAKPKAKKK
ncbi:MAG: hypothetical protein K0S07_699 [Chlamydiales bacterium]|jgi:hypothetical protein|nr:hypothetical protein [Chlamydiales bacterium]